MQEGSLSSLLQLPDTAILTILESLDARSLNALTKSSRYFNMFIPASGLKLTEHVARQKVLELHHGDEKTSQRFKYVCCPDAPGLLGFIFVFLRYTVC